MTPTITNNFNAPIGQYIAHVDKIEAHFDKDMTMHIASEPSLPTSPTGQIGPTNSIPTRPTSPTSPTPITIDDYFKGPFRGFGGNTDHLSQLKSELKNMNYSDTDICRIAVLIYNSHVLNQRRPHTFKDWYSIFTQSLNLPCSNPNRQPRHFQPTDDLRSKFYYIA